ncbi:hypothetical protein A0J61_05868 [Choanephora cucurbitarum]|uniref:Uncharacterized protein n=1 Tax=Choanephora cucurbitarum TaxID=101091 RepID=A0A1C7NAT0_9FUNG|nr:hypothetical protein A0J61_05868 [Choanephora cucurbitarum]
MVSQSHSCQAFSLINYNMFKISVSIASWVALSVLLFRSCSTLQNYLQLQIDHTYFRLSFYINLYIFSQIHSFIIYYLISTSLLIHSIGTVSHIIYCGNSIDSTTCHSLHIPSLQNREDSLNRRQASNRHTILSHCRPSKRKHSILWLLMSHGDHNPSFALDIQNFTTLVIPWTIRWPTLYTILFKLDHLQHSKASLSPLAYLGQRLLNWFSPLSTRWPNS